MDVWQMTVKSLQLEGYEMLPAETCSSQKFFILGVCGSTKNRKNVIMSENITCGAGSKGNSDKRI